MPSIKKNFFYSSILTTANYLFPLLTFPYISRVLGVTNVGIVNFVDSIINYFILVSMMGVGILGIREIAKYKSNRENLNHAFSGLFLLNTVTTSFALIILVAITIYVDQLRSHWHMMAIGAIKLVMNYMLIEWFYKGLEQFKFITIRTLIVKIAYVISVFVFVRNSSDYPIYYFLSVLMIAFNAIINLCYSNKYVSLQFANLHFEYYLKPFFILGLYQLLTSMYTSFNPVFLGFVTDETEVGYYTTATKLYRILIALFSAFTGVMLPRMSSLLSEGKTEDFKKLLIKSNEILFTCIIPVVIYTIIYARSIIYIVAGAGFEGSILPMQIMMPLMLVIGYEQILVIQALMPLKKDNVILYNSFMGALIGLILNILLVPHLKSVGTAIVWACSEIVVLIGAQYYVRKFVSVGFPCKILFLNLLYYSPLAIFLYLMYLQISNLLISLFLSAIGTLVYFIIYNIYLKKNGTMFKSLRNVCFFRK